MGIPRRLLAEVRTRAKAGKRRLRKYLQLVSSGNATLMTTLLEDITSGDAQRIWASACAIAILRDAGELELLSAHLPEIEKKTSGVELGGAFIPNSEHLKFALRKLRYVRSKAGCLCRLYPYWLMFNPLREEEAENIRILDKAGDGQWNTFYRCQCTLCATVFRVEEGEYHYIWWQWKVVKPSDIPPAATE